MAELNLTVQYKYMPARVLFILMLASLPVWEIAAPVGLGYMIRQIIWNAANTPFTLAATLIPGLILLIVLGIALTAFSEDNRIHLSKDGISFPPFLLLPLKFQRAWQWSELRTAGLAGDEPANQHLNLEFSGGRSLSLKLSCFAASELEQFLLAVELWGTNCKRSPELVDYQQRIQNQVQGLSQTPGYTQIWEEELARRFQSTSFVPLEPQQKLLDGRLEIIRQLAFGGLSAIYLAQENKTDLVVIKEAVVPRKAEVEARKEAERHLIREAELLSKFQHPRVAKVLDHFIENERHYLKLEYINGTDLRQYIKQNKPPAYDLAVDWGIQILEVLVELHSQNPPIIHRDLTPENLVLVKDSVMLIDFGAANEFVGTATGTIVGKQSYMPAEQLRGKSVIESDIYAFACTMHFLLTGKDPLPLSPANPKELCPDLDQSLNDLIERCSAFEPEDRYRSAAEVLAELKAIRAGMPETIAVESKV